MKKYCIIIVLVLVSGCSNTVISRDSDSIFNITQTPIDIDKTYTEIIKTDSIPGISTDFPFPLSKQYKNGCFGFAVKHVVQYKYGKTIDMVKAENAIKKPREELWTSKHITNFLDEYELKMKWFTDAETFFAFFQEGEPVIIQYKSPLVNGGWVGHFVAAYSFDDQGIWISESITNKRIRLDFSEVFDEEGKFTQFGFATVEKQS